MAEYIEKEAAIAIIEERQKQLCPVGMYSRHSVYGTDREKYDAWQEILDEIDYLPAANVRENVPGEWVVHKTKIGNEYTTCSNCKIDFSFRTDKGTLAKLDMRGTNFCPNCGAQMGVQDD